MADLKRIKTTLVSVYDKTGLAPIIKLLDELSIRIISTGGTKEYIEGLNIQVTAVEDITSYPSILGGRVKTLHPKIFGGILFRRDHPTDLEEAHQYDIPGIDLVIVDLYPFEATVESGASGQEIIEKIDIGGITLIRAAAKNFADVLIVSSKEQYSALIELLKEKQGETSLEDRQKFASEAFALSSHYDTAIYNYYSNGNPEAFKQSIIKKKSLRYGENPHQTGIFYGDLDQIFEKISGKEISYNNLLDIDAAVSLVSEFSDPTFAVLKHNNACGLASRPTIHEAWIDALAGDPVSAFGGVLIANREIDADTANDINKIFFEVIIAPSYQAQSLDILMQKKNRIILVYKGFQPSARQFRTLLNGVIVQDRDTKIEVKEDLKVVTKREPADNEIDDLLFANRIVKHTKSNAIVLVKDKQLVGSGTGQTSRIDALKQAIEKARNFKFDLQGAVMASDAFFPFSDSVEIAHKAGITAVIQPGGSIRDNDSIEYCNSSNMAMVFTGIRHFKH
ncbi:MAG: phosphoribosylaminoimidazolecarboxamide formyltransferase [Bacteroides sp. SM23_62_1]|nr:MAG: phosphoribosylaminoimidazolecarboxamide formyltransferase [Bacteroides sp. SM23_62_1]